MFQPSGDLKNDLQALQKELQKSIKSVVCRNFRIGEMI